MKSGESCCEGFGFDEMDGNDVCTLWKDPVASIAY